MLNSHIEVDIKSWSNAISSSSRWNAFRAGEGRELCDKLDEMSSLIETIITDPNGSKSKLDKAILASDNIVLTEREIELIAELQLSPEHLRTVRNLFVLIAGGTTNT